ncbi:MAG: RHS repeat-associated core domain-containing protein, partial [Bacteroidota bacterium]
SQVNEYYPYGLATNKSWRLKGYLDPWQLYQAGHANFDTLTGNYDFLYRSYDPVLGQFTAADPLAVVTPGHSPFHANYNNPVMFTDPLGLCPECPRDKRYYDARDNFMDYEPTSYVSPNLNGDNWMVWTGRHRDHWSDGIGFGNGFSSSDFNALWNSAFGGSWATSQGVDLFGSHSEAFSAGLGYNEYHNSWESTTFGSIGRGRRLAQHHFNGDFVQIGGDGKVYVPYTNVSYWDYKANAAANYNFLSGFGEVTNIDFSDPRNLFNEGVLSDMGDGNYGVQVTGTELGLAGSAGAAKVVKYVKNPKKIIVIGEDMLNRVIPYAEKYGFKYFKPRGKNPANWMKNQVQWIRRQIKDPNTTIIDIGPKRSTPASKYYMKELEMLRKWLGG